MTPISRDTWKTAGALLLAVMLLAPTLAPGAVGEAVVTVARFSAGDLRGWKARTFEGETTYTFDTVDDHRGLRAVSHGTASGLFRETAITLRQTPYLEWSWRVGNVLKGVDERTRSGDDYAARVYVIVSGGLAFWRTRSLVYVWSSNQPIGSTWDNAFTGNAKVIALRSGTAETDRWVSEKRNVAADLRRMFGDEVDQIDAVAVMTDTDNSGQSATAWYGDISFVAE